MKKILFIQLTVFLFSCSNNQKGAEDGGPCIFTDELSPITVVSTPLVRDSLYDIKFYWGDSTHPRTDSTEFLSFHEVNNRYVTATELKQFEIRPGKECNYVLSRTTHGSCNFQKSIRL